MDDFHFIEEMFSNPIGFILVLDFLKLLMFLDRVESFLS